MSEIKFVVSEDAMDLLENVVRSSELDRAGKKKFRDLHKAWRSSERRDAEEWTVTVSPPKNIVHIAEITKTRDGIPETTRSPMEK